MPCCALTGPKQTCFAASDVTSVYGVPTPVIFPNRKLVFTQLAAILLVARVVGSKTRNIAIQLVLQQFCKICLRCSIARSSTVA